MILKIIFLYAERLNTIPNSGSLTQLFSFLLGESLPLIPSWHSIQKAIFEWGQGLPPYKEDKAPHSEDAVRVTQHFANYFIRFVVPFTFHPTWQSESSYCKSAMKYLFIVQLVALLRSSEFSPFALTWNSKARQCTKRPCEDDVRRNLIDNYNSKFGQS